MTGYVYAMASGKTVKIGWSKEPKLRVSKVRSDTPADVVLIGFVEATIKQEKEIQAFLRPWRAFGEWFHLCGPVSDFVDALRGRGLVVHIPASKTPNHPLLAYRTAAGINQAEMARLIGVTVAQVSRIETGARQPYPQLAIKIEQKTGIPRGALRPDIFGNSHSGKAS